LVGFAQTFSRKIVEGVTVILRDEQPEAPVYQPGTRDAEQARPGQVHLPDCPLAVEGQVAHGGKVVKFSITRQTRFHRRSRRLEFLVLHFQLDLVHLQFMDQPLGCPFRWRNRLTLVQPRFGAAAPFAGIRRLILVLFHWLLPPLRFLSAGNAAPDCAKFQVLVRS